MEEYLITARSVTQAQRMAQLLERRGVRAVVGRVPMGLTGKGCGYVLRLRGQLEGHSVGWQCLLKLFASSFLREKVNGMQGSEP